MRISKTAIAVSVLSLFAAAMVPATSMAAGGASGAAVKYAKQGQIGEVITNPYKIAPLTAIIRSGGYALSDVSVRIVPKPNGSEIKYDVDRSEVLTHGGIPVFGLYPDYVNTVEVSYTRTDLKGEQKKISESYQIYAPPVYTEGNGTVSQKSTMFDTKVVKMDGEFKDRLYLVNNLLVSPPKGSRVVWNNPSGGALEWCFYPQNAIIDATGAVRWYMNVDSIYDMENVYHGGVMMGFQQGADGALTWGYGQRYVKYDIMGREIFNRRLPAGYADFSHSFDQAQNGNYLLRVAANDVKRPDGRNVRTVRDVIVEVTPAGRVVDDWRLWEILDPYRDVVIKSLDQGAVCLNLDADSAGKTLSSADLAAMDKEEHFGDITGVGIGRNWAHVNSVDYDPTDDSIIISSRHQSAIIKIGRDKQVKWILGAPDGWQAKWSDKVLMPVDKDGKPLKCQQGKCEGTNFDWTWTQHTAFRIDSKSDKRFVYVTAFDNGDGRGLEQPALPEMKYSRAVVFKVDQEKRTVEQLWEYGKERGHSWYSPVTSLTQYEDDKDSIMVYSATPEMVLVKGKAVGAPSPYLQEFKWGSTEPAVEIRINGSMGYQAMPFRVQKAFNHAK
ncbi:aryl-sulfate sulfotransferase [Sutterella wadsworthensis]|uniref:aryl-sulfate sulfotransferase n=1 Tax=Sutterella wadsworthensis TaxID=40545 RepID=UPI003AB93EF4